MNSKECVLIVEDDSSIRNFISTVLNANDYNVLIASSGAQALSVITSSCPDIVLLDLGLPDIDGLKLIKGVREWSLLPIIVVSARNRERDKVEALDAGADDYITKPFGTSELLARIRTAMRHKKNLEDEFNIQKGKFIAGLLTVDFDKHRVFLGDGDIHLTQNEFKIIALLARYSGKVLTYEYIIKNIWGPYAKCDNQILRVNMANIRRKIEKDTTDPKYIFTEVGVGYRMTEKD
ncbi:MAG: DNA-binding response regulator [Clostridiales bacterium GWF2_36_10]|nr:MAG: DNA-binding response regulator [Clostridiales bacterium GWF2_36_10]HAN20786.1 DNA-binding response regulator [Clostridiales bacterium]